jgi:hypothetical protein
MSMPMPVASSLRLVVLVLLAALPSALAAQTESGEAAKPLPCGEDAYTQARFRADAAAFWREALAAECGRAAPIPDGYKADVEHLLTAVAAAGACLATSVEWSAAQKHAAALRDAAIEDPVVQLAAAAAAVVADASRAVELIEQATGRLDVRARPVRFQCFVHQLRVVVFAKAGKPLAMKAEQPRLDELWCEAIGRDEFAQGRAPRFLLQAVRGIRGAQLGPDDEAFFAKLEQAAGKPHYAAAVMRGELQSALAWKARGTGAAASVGASDRARLAEHMKAAADAGMQACELGPEFPEAPTLLLKVLGTSGAKTSERRVFLDRAVAAQFDWIEAYNSFLHYSQPRWGGSPQDLLAFGDECAATKRYDTEVPGQLRVAIKFLCLDVRDPKAVWGDEGVQRQLEEIDAGQLAAARDDLGRLRAQTCRIVSLALAGRGADAAAAFEKAGKLIETSVLDSFGVNAAWLKKTLLPHLADYEPPVVVQKDLFAGFADAALPGAAKARPLADHPKATTTAASRADHGRWIAEIYAAASARHGAPDPAWQDDLQRLFESTGQSIAKSDDRTPEVASLAAAARSLLAAGCKDPVAQYVAARALRETDPDESDRLAAASLGPIRRGDSTVLKWWALSSQAIAGRRSLLPEARRMVAVAAADPVFAGRRGRHYIRETWGDRDYKPRGVPWLDRDGIAALTKHAAANPWVVHVSTGLFHVSQAKSGRLAKQARAEALAQAAGHFTAAHGMQPDCPEAATGMILVTALAPELDGATPREWFDRALDAQIDFQPAFQAYVETLTPEAGGSLAAMFRFAVECLESRRFDTDLPYWFVLTLAMAQKDAGAGRSVWAAVGVRERLDALFDGYLASESAPMPPEFWREGRYLTAWAGGRYDDAIAVRGERKGGHPYWARIVGLDEPASVEIDLDARLRKRAAK